MRRRSKDAKGRQTTARHADPNINDWSNAEAATSTEYNAGYKGPRSDYNGHRSDYNGGPRSEYNNGSRSEYNNGPRGDYNNGTRQDIRRLYFLLQNIFLLLSEQIKQS